MAFTGLHVYCSFVGAKGRNQRNETQLSWKPNWSETLATAGITTSVAPSASPELGFACFGIVASADSWVSIGPNPNATTGPRFLLKANEEKNVFCDAGDKLAWIAA